MDRKLIISVLLFLIITSGFFYSYDLMSIRTPTGKVVIDFSSNTVIMPIKVHIVKDSSGLYTSFRDEENILNLFNEVNRIWSQADIYFSIEEIVITEVSSEAIPDAMNVNYLEFYNNQNFDKDKINVFFTQSLNGINGIALAKINTALIADFTTVNDFRATSHELGHLLGLKHVPPADRLMARGMNGELLTSGEILITRENAIAS
ncbi:MAG: hypothetical protein IIA87_04260 [Nanoarchaeota archaeon]|nr:hypothetical protein [Nanoarchaeota archaeon]